jgi:hypothetical protein
VALSKLDLAAVAALALALLWIEHDHRIIIGTPAAAEVAKAAPVCPDTDDVPFSADCLAFIGARAQAALAPRPNAAPLALPALSGVRERMAADKPACPPSNENAPYSASCLRFLSGWYWQPDAAARLP